MKRIAWSEAMIAEKIMENYKNTGAFPTVSYLKRTGQNALAVKITRTGGFLKWAERLGLQRELSDSDKGWAGELEVMAMLQKRWPNVTRPTQVKCPFDLLVEGVLRVDVKSARFCTYGHCSGWFYRIGKIPQADIVALIQIDTKDVYWIPWHKVPPSSITITKTGDTYTVFKNNMDIVRRMLEIRMSESF